METIARKGQPHARRPINVTGIWKTKSTLAVKMPELKKLIPISHLEHYRSFGGFYVNVDVWTHNGWLITAIQDDNKTCHVRKGDEAGLIYLTDDTQVYATKRCPEERRWLGFITPDEQYKLFIEAVVYAASCRNLGIL